MGTKSEFLYNDFYYTSLEKQALLNKLKMGTQEWAKKELNCIKGCHNNCIYCYGKSIAKRFKRCTEETWKHMEINKLAINKNYQKVKKKGNQPYDIMFPTSHDIFIKEPYFTTYTKMLKKLVTPGNSVLIVSKPNPKVIETICENFKKYKEKLGFRFTIGSVDSKLLRVFEPNAPSFEDRLKALKIAKDYGFNTSISVEPLLDDDPEGLINKLSPHLSSVDYKLDIGTIWIGLLKINYILY